MNKLIGVSILAVALGTASAAAAATINVFGSAVRPTPSAAAAAAYQQAATSCQNQGGTPTSGMVGTLEWNGSGYLYYGYITCDVP